MTGTHPCQDSNIFLTDSNPRASTCHVSVNDGVEPGRVIQTGGNPNNTPFDNTTIVIGSHQKVKKHPSRHFSRKCCEFV